MHRIWIVAFGCLALDAAGCGVAIGHAPLQFAGSLQGRWEVVSMMRDGRPDPTQVGALLTFEDDRVISQPKVVQVVADGTS